MKDYRELTRLIERSIHMYNQMEKNKSDYGTGVMLSRAEIHTIADVGDYPEINVTKLAKLKGVTKGASSQMIYRLVDKGMIRKEVSPKSDTEVCLTLTELGKKAYEKHQEYHATANEKFIKMLRDMSEEENDRLVEMLRVFNQAMEDFISKEKGCRNSGESDKQGKSRQSNAIN